jgi:hypothetical protein
MLITWKAKNIWLGKYPNVCQVLSKHFDGDKFHEYQMFWNFKVEWETLVIYPNNKCYHTFQAFPLGQKCEKLVQHWNLQT